MQYSVKIYSPFWDVLEQPGLYHPQLLWKKRLVSVEFLPNNKISALLELEAFADDNE